MNFWNKTTTTTSAMPPSEQSIKKINNMDDYYNSVIKLSQGTISSIDEDKKEELEEFTSENKISHYNNNMNPKNDSSGRTLNVPKQLKPGIIPIHSYNGARTTGELCEGGHCSIPNNPLSSNFVSQNYGFLYSSTPRPGNNTEINPETFKYKNPNSLNYGPFNITVAKSDPTVRDEQKGVFYTYKTTHSHNH